MLIVNCLWLIAGDHSVPVDNSRSKRSFIINITLVEIKLPKGLPVVLKKI